MAQLPDDFPKWPHLENHYKHPDYKLKAEWLTVTEKIHGFNARFGRTLTGTFWVGSRNNVVEEDGLQGFAEWAASLAPLVRPGFTFFGEWAGKGIQKGIDYGEEKRYFLFGMMLNNGRQQNLLDWRQVMTFAETLDIGIVPTLYDGPAKFLDMDHVVQWASNQSLVSNDEREGVCVSAWPPVTDQYGHLLILKVKNPKFAERKSDRTPRAPRPEMDTANAFADDYVTEERMDHVLALVAESTGSDPLWPEFTVDVLKTYYADVMREGAKDYAALEPNAQKMVGKALNTKVKPMLTERRLRANTVANIVGQLEY